MRSSYNVFLILGSLCSALAAIAHLGCIIFGGDWYRFFGAGEQLARMADDGHWYPSAVTSVIAVVLIVWSLYGLSGAKVIPRLPLLKFGLLVISAIYLFRGLGFIFLMPMFPENSLTFWVVSSGICFLIGVLYAIGTVNSWRTLAQKIHY